MVLVTRPASWRGRLDTASLLLAGVAVSYTLAALTSFVMVFAREQMATVVFWMMGGLSGASWPYVVMIAPMFAVGAVAALMFTRDSTSCCSATSAPDTLGSTSPASSSWRLRSHRCSQRRRWPWRDSSDSSASWSRTWSGSRWVPTTARCYRLRCWRGDRARVGRPYRSHRARARGDPVGIVTALIGGPFFLWLLVKGERV